MADSVREKILKNVVTVLKTIDGTGSFNTDLNDRVFRFASSGLSQAAYPMALVEEPTESLEWRNASPQILYSTMNLSISVWQEGIPDGTIEASTIVSNMVADVVLALLADVTRGGDAVETHVDSVESNVSQEVSSLCSAKVNFRIVYRFLSADPSTRL